MIENPPSTGYVNTMQTIGFIGVGAMGGGMARQLLNAGHRLIAFDIDDRQLRSLADAGAEPAADPGDLARTADVVMTSLPAPEIFVEVAQRHLLPVARDGQVIIDFGTSQPTEVRRLADAFAARGAAMLDAPVSGGASGAAQGTLRVFVGGDEAVFQRCQPLLHIVGEPSLVLYCGPSGSGQIIKVVNQLAMGLGVAAYLESLAFGVRQGISADLLHRAVGGSDEAWRTHFAQIADRIIAGRGNNIGVKAGQLEHFLQEAAAAGIPMPMTAALHAFCRDADKPVMEANRPSASYWKELMERDAP
jgi:3-hydroxyisobutyrate dehydrogenase-like beta-hydroxyacid dehydrogenase